MSFLQKLYDSSNDTLGYNFADRADFGVESEADWALYFGLS